LSPSVSKEAEQCLKKKRQKRVSLVSQVTLVHWLFLKRNEVHLPEKDAFEKIPKEETFALRISWKVEFSKKQEWGLAQKTIIERNC
jgi:hypothetical protein